MEKIYTLKELREMTKKTKKVASEMIANKTQVGEIYTSAELAKLTDGLCSTNSIAIAVSRNSFLFNNAWLNFGSYGTKVVLTGKYSLIAVENEEGELVICKKKPITRRVSTWKRYR